MKIRAGETEFNTEGVLANSSPGLSFDNLGAQVDDGFGNPERACFQSRTLTGLMHTDEL